MLPARRPSPVSGGPGCRWRRLAPVPGRACRNSAHRAIEGARWRLHRGPSRVGARSGLGDMGAWPLRRMADHEADLPAEQDPPQAHPRLPRAHEHPRREGCDQAPPGEGPEATGADGSVQVDVRPRDGRFRRSSRLRRSRDFHRVSREGARRASAHFVLVVAPRRGAGTSEAADPVRLGLAVGRRVGGAVRRNLLRRRLREWFRHHREELRDGWGEDIDVVVIARPGSAELSYREIAAELGTITAPRGDRRRRRRGAPTDGGAGR